MDGEKEDKSPQNTFHGPSPVGREFDGRGEEGGKVRLRMHEEGEKEAGDGLHGGVSDFPEGSALEGQGERANRHDEQGGSKGCPDWAFVFYPREKKLARTEEGGDAETDERAETGVGDEVDGKEEESGDEWFEVAHGQLVYEG